MTNMTERERLLTSLSAQKLMEHFGSIGLPQITYTAPLVDIVSLLVVSSKGIERFMSDASTAQEVMSAVSLTGMLASTYDRLPMDLAREDGGWQREVTITFDSTDLSMLYGMAHLMLNLYRAAPTSNMMMEMLRGEAVRGLTHSLASAGEALLAAVGEVDHTELTLDPDEDEEGEGE